MSPRLTPLPEQLEPADSSKCQQALDHWDDAPVEAKQAHRVREYELSAMKDSDSTPQCSNSTFAAAPHNQVTAFSNSIQRHSRTASTEQPAFHTPEGSRSCNQSQPCSALGHKLPSQEESVLDEAFPTIRKITPVGSPETDETLHGHFSCANPLQADQAYASHDSQVISSSAYLYLLA